jgi:NAD(P)-dependent dehydrogenase (short-subunit alcohol dehydrogenase family)
MAPELAGHTAFVTGSGRNIGRAIAVELAARGANVVVNARSNAHEAAAVAAECATLGVATEVVIGNAAEQATIDAAARAGEAFGGIDVVVSNAAVRPYQSLADMAFADWQAVLDTQLNASFRLASTFVPRSGARPVRDHRQRRRPGHPGHRAQRRVAPPRHQPGRAVERERSQQARAADPGGAARYARRRRLRLRLPRLAAGQLHHRDRRAVLRRLDQPGVTALTRRRSAGEP